MKRLIILLVVFILTPNLFSQILDSTEDSTKFTELEASVADLYLKGKEKLSVRDYAAALPYFLKIDSLSKKFEFINDTTIKAVLDRSEISRVTFTPAGVEMAKDLQLEALKMAEEIGSDQEINEAYTYLATIYEMVDELPLSKKYTDKAFRYYKTHDNAEKLGTLYIIYMNYYFKKEQLDSAEAKLKEGIVYLEGKDEPARLARVKVFLGNLYEKYKNNSKKAIPLFKEARIIYRELEDTVNLNYLYILEGLGKCHADLREYQKAFQYYQLAYNARREFEKSKNTLLTRNLETKYQTEKKQQEIELLTIKNSIAETEKANQRTLLIAVIVIFLLLAGIFYTLYRSRQKVNQKLKQINEMKSTFFANISHEFRTPLTLIKAPAELQLASTELSEAQREQLTSINRNADRLLDLVDQLLDLSKLEAKKIVLKVSPMKPIAWFEAITHSFQFSAEQKNIDFKVVIDISDKELMLDAHLIEKVINNLLGNAIKYTNKDGEIVFEAMIKAEKLSLKIQNTGDLIAVEDHGKVFDRFYQLNTHRTGVGIGLALVKELVELHHGAISLATNASHNIFTIEIPIKEADYSKEEVEILNSEKVKFSSIQQIDIENESIENTSDEIVNDDLLKEERAILLIVEDNAEIRKLIRQQFQVVYNVKEAENGEQGIQIALEIVPDIIISDIMMPGTDGIELTKQLKTDERTSHIPIILLTAKAGEENELIGLENKADDYILKPFSPEKLKVRVQNLIHIRKKLRERYSQEVILKPKDIAISTHDDIFLEKVQLLLEEKLTDSEFTSEYFSKEIGMSRMQLHRKLKALVGLSTSEFIRSQRLKLAVNLLKKGQDNMSEVAYMVGFNDPSYFTRCFKEVYGVSPGNYKEKQL